ncbi:MAG: ISAzo13-like element transposase-related protein [Phycisphaerae bacterium]
MVRQFLSGLQSGQALYPRVSGGFGHDFPDAASGMVHPHGFYDVGLNRGYINLGTGHDTSEFACARLDHWWNTQGRQSYPNPTRLLLLCNGGGSNNASSG